MPKYYCDYCDIFLTHDSVSVRKAHNTGWKHINQVASYYRGLEPYKTQEVVDALTKAYGGQPLPMPDPAAYPPPPPAVDNKYQRNSYSRQGRGGYQRRPPPYGSRPPPQHYHQDRYNGPPPPPPPGFPMPGRPPVPPPHMHGYHNGGRSSSRDRDRDRDNYYY